MGFLFRKRIKLFPGVWFNLSKGGVSTFFGVKGLTVNINDDRVKTTASIPGAGLSYRETIGIPDDSAPVCHTIPFWVWLLLIVVALVLLVR